MILNMKKFGSQMGRILIFFGIQGMYQKGTRNKIGQNRMVLPYRFNPLFPPLLKGGNFYFFIKYS
jgi:hypothetical protein